MADVEVNQTPAGSSANWIWAVVVIVLIALVAWFFFAGGGGRRGRTNETKIEVNTPAGGATGTVKTP